MELDPYLISLTKINSKQIKGLNERPNTVKLEENLGGKLLDTDLAMMFWMTQKAQATKAKMSK